MLTSVHNYSVCDKRLHSQLASKPPEWCAHALQPSAKKCLTLCEQYDATDFRTVQFDEKRVPSHTNAEIRAEIDQQMPSYCLSNQLMSVEWWVSWWQSDKEIKNFLSFHQRMTPHHTKLITFALPSFSDSISRLLGWLEFNVPFQHKYGYITDEIPSLVSLIAGLENLVENAIMEL